jgi:hypothetical protein
MGRRSTARLAQKAVDDASAEDQHEDGEDRDRDRGRHGGQHTAQRGEQRAGGALEQLRNLMLGARELLGQVPARVEVVEGVALPHLAQEPGRVLDELRGLVDRRRDEREAEAHEHGHRQSDHGR